METHILHLEQDPFNAILKKEKTVESRLFDDKRRTIQLGDKITFVNKINPQETIEAEVIGLLRYRSFHAMFLNQDFHKFGGTSIEQLDNQINAFYQQEDQDKRGVIGIEFII